MKLIAIDPGIRGCGVALFENDTLQKADYVKNPLGKGNRIAECREMAHVVFGYIVQGGDLEYQRLKDPHKDIRNKEVCLAVEWPQVYTQGKGDNNDLLALAGVTSAFTALISSVWGLDGCEAYLPREWKGQMTKEVCHARIEKILTPEELARVATKQKTLRHNTLDAVGVGLFHLGRFKKERAIAR